MEKTDNNLQFGFSKNQKKIGKSPVSEYQPPPPPQFFFSNKFIYDKNSFHGVKVFGPEGLSTSACCKKYHKEVRITTLTE